MKRLLTFFTLLGVLTCCVVAYSFIILGSPFEKRALDMDQKRIQHFNSIHHKLTTYFNTQQKLPSSLKNLPSVEKDLLDPETRNEYDYQMISNNTYKLCTTFAADGKEQDLPARIFRPTYDYSTDTHTEGYYCYQYTLQPQQARQQRNTIQQGSIHS